MRVLLAALGLAALVLALAWSGLRPGSGSLSPEAVPRAGAAGEERAAAPPPGTSPPEERAPSAPDATTRAPEAEEPGGTSPPRGESVALWLMLQGPDGRPVQATDVRASFTAPDSEAYVFTDAGPVQELWRALPEGRYEMRVSARELRSLPRPVEARRAAAEKNAGLDGPPAVYVVAYLFGDTWIPLVLRTRDGRPFSAIAADLGLEPKRLFVDAFALRAERERDAFEASPDPDAPRLMRFHPAPGYQRVELVEGVAGTLELYESPPFWVGLSIHGRPQETKLLEPGARELVFELDLGALDRSMAGLSLRVVDRDTRAPVAGALVTLKADTSAHRRDDLSGVPTGADGRLHLARVIPGQHELTIARGQNLVQQRLRLVAGEERELGDVEIGDDPGVPLRVVTPDGEPMRAAVEIAPFEPGADTTALYPPNLHRWTNGAGSYELPVPDRVSVVRARPLFDGPRTYPRQVGTRNALLDPAALPTELVLTAYQPARVRFEPATPWRDGHALVVTDELGLVIGRVTDLSRQLELVPGTYRLRRLDGERELGTLEVTVAADTKTLRAP